MFEYICGVISYFCAVQIFFVGFQFFILIIVIFTLSDCSFAHISNTSPPREQMALFVVLCRCFHLSDFIVFDTKFYTNHVCTHQDCH